MSKTTQFLIKNKMIVRFGLNSFIKDMFTLYNLFSTGIRTQVSNLIKNNFHYFEPSNFSLLYKVKCIQFFSFFLLLECATKKI